ncbi:fumarylacetoacetate hydrolase family protein [Paraferrimonas sp. SM1919]|uniref:fumarylacetoacetate hydrolase family protein n=1 Tax=Paraferrimonas sp. SM1919 TaxID=2662263 RepID=UPI0013D3431E|nr:fumarylacetoacetate hydrolase family protein [Paraferrimonas sp. SM1919]
MKLASLKHGRDGHLVVVNKALTHYFDASHIAANLQQALDDWHNIEPALQRLADEIEQNIGAASCFDESLCASPLPRALQWLDGSSYVNHVELVRKARGAEMPERFWHDPLMYQGNSDSFLAPHEAIVHHDEAYGIDFEAEVAVIVDDVPMGVSPQQALKHIKLILLVNDISLRNLIPDELAKGFGFLQSKPSCSFSPVALTPNELGQHWHGGKLHLPIYSYLNQQLVGKPNAGIDMTFDFGTLISHAAKTRKLTAGTIIGSGTVSNTDRSQGCSCLAEVRMLEILDQGEPKTPFMHFGDRIKIEMLDHQGNSLFGCIDQTVEAITEQDHA